MRRKILLFGVCIVCLLSRQVVFADHVRAPIGSHYLEWKGKPLILVGDSVTQGWFESGKHFDYKGYIDALSRRNMNVVMLWSFIATDKTKQLEEKDWIEGKELRIGYDAPEIWPWVGKPDHKNFDLRFLNQEYFNHLKDFVDYAEEQNMIVLISVFDGWIKSRFNCHPFNKALGGGPLSSRDGFVEFDCFRYKDKTYREMGSAYRSGWNWKQKNQYFQE